MKFSLKTLLLSILVLSYILNVVDSKASRKHKKNRSHVSVDDKDKAAKTNTAGNIPPTKGDKKDKGNKICCHLQFKDEQSKLPGSVTSIHVWGNDAKCVSSPKVDVTKTALSKEDCKKQEIKRNTKADSKDNKKAVPTKPKRYR